MGYVFKYRALSEALYNALTDDAFYIAMEVSVEGKPAHRREAMLRYYDYSIQEARRYGSFFAPDGLPVGVSIWSRPVSDDHARQMSDEKQAFLKTYMGSASLEKYLQICGFMAQQAKSIISPDSWYLSIVGLAPQYQGQGRGVSLIRPILDRTDSLGCPAYLETFTRRNMQFYRRLGFEEAGGFDEPGTKARYWIMIRGPSSS